MRKICQTHITRLDDVRNHLERRLTMSKREATMLLSERNIAKLNSAKHFIEEAIKKLEEIELMSDKTQNPQSCQTDVCGSTLKKRTYSKHCPNCGTTAKFDTEKYCSDSCKIEYKAMLERKFG